MISKNKLKELAAYRQQRRCDEEAVFVVEGPKMCAEAAASGFNIRVVCATEEWKVESGECYEVTQAELERLSNLKSPNQVWMLVERPVQLPATDGRMVLALDRLQDPGIRHIVCSRDTVDCYNPKVVQASMGAIFRTRVDYVDLPQWLAACGMTVYGASLQGTPITERTMRNDGRSVLLIGNESRGISSEAMAQVTHPVLIPNIGGTAESLNASVAAGILIDRLWNS